MKVKDLLNNKTKMNIDLVSVLEGDLIVDTMDYTSIKLLSYEDYEVVEISCELEEDKYRTPIGEWTINIVARMRAYITKE